MKLSLLDLINLFKEHWWQVKEDKPNYVVLINPDIKDTDAFWNLKNVLSIPKYLDDLEDFRSTFELKTQKLLKYVLNEKEKEKLKYINLQYLSR